MDFYFVLAKCYAFYKHFKYFSSFEVNALLNMKFCYVPESIRKELLNHPYLLLTKFLEKIFNLIGHTIS